LQAPCPEGRPYSIWLRRLFAPDAEIGSAGTAGEERHEIDDSLTATLDGPELPTQSCKFGVDDGKRGAARLACHLEDVDDASDVTLQVRVRPRVARRKRRIDRAPAQQQDTRK